MKKTKIFLLTIRKGQNTDDKEEWDDQDEPHPHITVRIPIISADSKNNPYKCHQK